MSTADDLFRAGDVDGARAALVELVRSRPADAQARMFLFQLLAVAGEWDKARTQLTALASLSPEAQMLSGAYGQAIDAERIRARVFAGTEPPALLVSGSAWAGDLALALHHLAAGRIAEATEARDRAFDAAPDTPGTLDGTPFEWIADADSRFGPAFEAIIAGKWGLIPFDAVEKITGEGAQDLRDIVWYPVQVAFRTGQSIAALLPVRYPGSETAADPALRLARATAWDTAEWGEAGSGQHLFALSTGEERDLLSLRTLTFD